jgi:hypothetical protein
VFDVVLVQVAMHNAIQAIEQNYQAYLDTPPAAASLSSAAAAAGAAWQVLSDDRICPAGDATQDMLDNALLPYAGDPGLGVGFAAGLAMLAEHRPAPLLTFGGNTDIGQWRPTPPSNLNMQFVYLATTTPFTLNRPSQFRPGPPPPMQSQVYAREYNEVKSLGSAGSESHPLTASCPAPSSTEKARFWSGNFVVQWNQVGRQLADAQLSLGDSARLLALMNLAAADALIAVWESKLYYNFWRPITAIQFGDSDPNARTAGDPSWVPFIENQNHFPPPMVGPPPQTPAYPDYVSGANGITGAYLAMLQFVFGTDSMSFTVNKATTAVTCAPHSRSFTRFSDAAQEVVDARILLGIHFRSADEEARRLGTRVAHWTFQKTLRPSH